MNPPRPGDPLTDRQREIFNWMVAYTIELFYQPSIREVGERFGINSPNGVVCHLVAMEKRGLLSLSGCRSRAIVFHRRTPINEGE